MYVSRLRPFTNSLTVRLQTMHKSQEDCGLLRDRLLELIPVVVMALKDWSAGKKDADIPADLKRILGHFER